MTNEIGRFTENGHRCIAYVLYDQDGTRTEFITRIPLALIDGLDESDAQAIELIHYDEVREQYPHLSDTAPTLAATKRRVS